MQCPLRVREQLKLLRSSPPQGVGRDCSRSKSATNRQYFDIVEPRWREGGSVQLPPQHSTADLGEWPPCTVPHDPVRKYDSCEMQRLYTDLVPNSGVYADMQAPRRASKLRSYTGMCTPPQRQVLCPGNAPRIPLRLPDSITRGVCSSACDAGMTIDMAMMV